MKSVLIVGIFAICVFTPLDASPSIGLLSAIKIPESLKFWSESPKKIVNVPVGHLVQTQTKPIVVPEYPAYKIHKYQGFRLTPVPVSQIPIYQVAGQQVVIEPHVLQQGLSKIGGLLGTSSNAETIAAVQEIASTSDGLSFMTDYIQNNFGLKDISEPQVKQMVNSLQYQIPSSNYGPPPPVYGPPPPVYGLPPVPTTPAPVYGPPPPVYGSPKFESKSDGDSSSFVSSNINPISQISSGSSSGSLSVPAKTYGPPPPTYGVPEKKITVSTPIIEDTSAFSISSEPASINIETNEESNGNEASVITSSEEMLSDFNEEKLGNGKESEVVSLPEQNYGPPPSYAPPKPYLPAPISVSSQVLGNAIQDLSLPSQEGGSIDTFSKTPISLTYSNSYGAPPPSPGYSVPGSVYSVPLQSYSSPVSSFNEQNPIVVGASIQATNDDQSAYRYSLESGNANKPELKVRFSQGEESGRPVMRTEYEQEGFSYTQLSSIPLDRTVSFKASPNQVSSYGDSISSYIFQEDQLPSPSEPKITVVAPQNRPGIKKAEEPKLVLEQHSVVSSNNPLKNKYQRRKWMPKVKKSVEAVEEHSPIRSPTHT